MSSSTKIEEIQVLRAVAVILVVVFHARFDLTGSLHPALATFFGYLGGDAGVDLFFVISGFVIARSLVPTLQATVPAVQARRALLVFWLKRAFRLLPSAWFWLSFTLVCALFFNKSGAFGHFKAVYEGAIAAMLNVANFRFQACFGWFECGPTTYYWGLSLASQFYVVLPLLVLLSGRFLLPVLLVLLLSQFPASTSLPPMFRFGGLTLGVLLAIFSLSQGYRLVEPAGLLNRRGLSASLFIFLILVLSTTQGGDLKVVQGNLKFSLVIFPAALMVLLASYGRGYLLPAGRLRSLLTAIGDRSYGLFLTHIPAFCLSREILFGTLPTDVSKTQLWLNHGLLAAGLMLLFSEINYRFIESPWQRRGQTFLARWDHSGDLPSAKQDCPGKASHQIERRA